MVLKKAGRIMGCSSSVKALPPSQVDTSGWTTYESRGDPSGGGVDDKASKDCGNELQMLYDTIEGEPVILSNQGRAWARFFPIEHAGINVKCFVRKCR